MLKFNYFNADKTPFKQRLNESDERERKTSKNVLFVLENCTFRFADYSKIFCLLELSGHWQFYNLKVDPDFSLDLQDRYSSIRPGFHMNKRHWISIDFNSSIPLDIEKNIIHHAYNQTAKGLTKKMRGELGFE